jgi:hypothetical protein|nr:MAG TPA: hypothetical protein [Caudoviricetes sp.]
MSRSRKKHAIIKDKTGHSWYNRCIRRRHRQQVKAILTLQDVMDYELINPKALVNDYNVCDYVLDFDNLSPFWSRYLGTNKEVIDKVKRK